MQLNQPVVRRIQIIDGNNQFFLNMSRAANAQDLARRCFELHQGFDIVYWVFDGLDSRKPRRDLYPEYKVTPAREKHRTDTGRYDLLKNFKHKQLPERGGVIVVEIPFIEADDIIRKLATFFSSQPNHWVNIASNDVDLFELTALKGVTQPQAKLPSCCENPAQIPIYKTLVGDTSDNIKGLKGFGDAAWLKLSPNDLALITLFLKSGLDMNEKCLLDDLKLKAKLIEGWQQLKLWYKLVDAIPVSDEQLMRNLKIYPKKMLNLGTNQSLTMG